MSEEKFRQYILEICESAKKASRTVANLATNERNGILYKIADSIRSIGID